MLLNVWKSVKKSLMKKISSKTDIDIAVELDEKNKRIQEKYIEETPQNRF